MDGSYLERLRSRIYDWKEDASHEAASQLMYAFGGACQNTPEDRRVACAYLREHLGEGVSQMVDPRSPILSAMSPRAVAIRDKHQLLLQAGAPADPFWLALGPVSRSFLGGSILDLWIKAQHQMPLFRAWGPLAHWTAPPIHEKYASFTVDRGVPFLTTSLASVLQAPDPNGLLKTLLQDLWVAEQVSMGWLTVALKAQHRVPSMHGVAFQEAYLTLADKISALPAHLQRR